MLTHTVLFPLWHLSWLNSTVHIILFFSWINYPLVLYLYWICFSFRGEVSILETKNGARIPHQYTAGDVLHSKSPIFAYTSGKEFLIINFSFIFYYYFFFYHIKNVQYSTWKIYYENGEGHLTLMFYTTGHEIAPNTVANATKIIVLATKIQKLVTKMVTRTLWVFYILHWCILQLNEALK